MLSLRISYHAVLLNHPKPNNKRFDHNFNPEDGCRWPPVKTGLQDCQSDGNDVGSVQKGEQQ